MASAVACKGPALATLKKMLGDPSATGAPVVYCALSPATVTALRRLYNTQGSEARRYDDNDDTSEESDADAGGRRRARDSDLPSFFSQSMRPPGLSCVGSLRSFV
jgi:hypothetical protein